MSDPARLDSDPNEDRIAKWRAERLRIAAREKEERLAARNAAKDAARKEAEALRKKAALSLIPTEPELLRTQERLSRNLRRARMAAWAQFAALVLLPLAAIGAYDWPGNIRELRNVIEHAVLLSEENDIQPATLRIGGATADAACGVGGPGWIRGVRRRRRSR